MDTHPALLSRRRRNTLSAGLVTALGAAGSVLCPADATASTLHVANCADSGPGSLRATIAAVGEGGTVIIDDTLPCSTITLTSGAIQVTRNSLYLTGPGVDSFAISGGGNSGVLRHSGNGNLGITGLRISDGKYTSTTLPFGGCIYSTGNVGLQDAMVSNCMAVASGPNPARGGGIYARGNLSLRNSTISGNVAFGAHAESRGGGVYVTGSLIAKYSILRDNAASSTQNYFSLGGAMWTRGDTYVLGSLITGNKALVAAAIGSEPAIPGSTMDLVNSTVSSNKAYFRFGGIYTHVPLSLLNTTVAFNQAPDGGAVYVVGASIALKSSIIADNTSNGKPADLDGVFDPAPTGSNNLITSSTIGVPAGTITACPKLGPLAANGAGAMQTHALLSNSPAIDKGYVVTNEQHDQRGTGFPRVFGTSADIGAFERQGGKDDRIAIAGFEPVCDH